MSDSTTVATMTKAQWRRHVDTSPIAFRNVLEVDTDTGVRCLGEMMADFQERDFLAIDDCMRHLAGIQKREPKSRRFWIQRARGHSKTTDVATEITWLLYSSKRRVNGICAAEDKDQARLIRDAMVKIGKSNPWLKDRLAYKVNEIENIETGSKLEVVSSDTKSSWGALPDFVVCDEFTHWSRQEFWHSCFSSFGKKTGMLIVACNAGAGHDWKYKVREMARTNKLWHYSAPEGCIAPWIDEETLNEQRQGLPTATFGRYWLNTWQESGGEYVTEEEVLACRDTNLFPRECTYADGWTYVGVVDYAPKKDYTVGTIMHLEGDDIIVDRMDVAVPTQGRTMRVDWVETWMKNMNKRFGATRGHVHFVVDNYQLIGINQNLKDLGFDITEFEFKSGIGNWKMAVVLRSLIMHQRIRWYEGCGKIDVEGEDYDLEYELSALVMKEYSGSTRYRFDHHEDGFHHDDMSFTLAAGSLFIAEMSGGFEAFVGGTFLDVA